jgi:hypothetical protein
MNPLWMRVTGYVLHFLIGGLVFSAGAGKVFGFAPKEIVQTLNSWGLGSRIPLLGTGEMITVLLLLIPMTSSLGVLVMSGFWGGVICIHMANGQDFFFPSVMLALTWVGGFLRDVRTLWSFSPWAELKPDAAPAVKQSLSAVG